MTRDGQKTVCLLFVAPNLMSHKKEDDSKKSLGTTSSTTGWCERQRNALGIQCPDRWTRSQPLAPLDTKEFQAKGRLVLPLGGKLGHCSNQDTVFILEFQVLLVKHLDVLETAKTAISREGLPSPWGNFWHYENFKSLENITVLLHDINGDE